MPRIAGHIRAPPIPIPTRAPMSHGVSWATPPSSENPAKIAVPTKNVPRRPNRSARRPPVTIAIPKTRQYALITHCTVPTSTLKSFSIAGSATLSAVKSLAITITPSPIATSAMAAPGARRSAPAAGASAAGDRSLVLASAEWRRCDPANGIAPRYPEGRRTSERAWPPGERDGTGLEAVEEARVVGADPVDAEPGESPHPRQVVDGPRDQLEPGVVALRGEPRGDQRVVGPHRAHPEPLGAAPHDARQSAAHRDHPRRDEGLRPRDLRPVAGDLRQRPAAAERRLDSPNFRQARDVHGRDPRPREQLAVAQRADQLVLAPGDLQVAVELDAVERRAGEGVEGLLKREGLSARRVRPVVGDEERSARVARRPRRRPAPIAPVTEVRAGAQDVELDHLDPRRDRGLEAIERVARPDPVGTLVADALQARET